ncbi:unnamed protein product [Nesidiocoris tenuis]|uniref:Uncharacterized protein n=1 Tax=Nesidiocoris tenuis TaxID=355587 RepID=A0A6H5HD52_9HEMI|nr:unnamed protein product [Nesidiocoris tenuis]
MVLDKGEQAIVSSFVVPELPRVRHPVVLPRRRRRRPGRHGVPMEQRRSQANGQVARRHLIRRREGRNVGQELEQELESFSMLVRKEKKCALYGLYPKSYGYICNENASNFPVPSGPVRRAVFLHDGRQLQQRQLPEDQQLAAGHGRDRLPYVRLGPDGRPLEAMPSHDAPAWQIPNMYN